jgi:hypothetical protein
VGYVVFGDIKQPLNLSASKYRSAGVPQGVQISSYTAERHAETFRFFLESSFLKALTAEDPTLVKAVLAQKQCVELRGEVKDPPTLNYFRDALGLVTCLLDQGGVAVLDVQILKWWSPVEWHKQIFDHGQAYPRHHVVIQITPEEGTKEWLHTRGMRKFGRPDISVRGVTSQYRNAVIDLCNRFIEMQAFGAIISEGQEIRMESLPPGMRAHHWGSVDDLAFNNVHIEIAWPVKGKGESNCLRLLDLEVTRRLAPTPAT